MLLKCDSEDVPSVLTRSRSIQSCSVSARHIEEIGSICLDETCGTRAKYVALIMHLQSANMLVSMLKLREFLSTSNGSELEILCCTASIGAHVLAFGCSNKLIETVMFLLSYDLYVFTYWCLYCIVLGCSALCICIAPWKSLVQWACLSDAGTQYPLDFLDFWHAVNKTREGQGGAYCRKSSCYVRHWAQCLKCIKSLVSPMKGPEF